MVLAPPSALGSAWMRRLGPVSTGFASGWMRLGACAGGARPTGASSSPTMPIGTG
jgi:hypothetical protein